MTVYEGNDADYVNNSAAISCMDMPYYDEITESVLLYHQIQYAYVYYTISVHSHSIDYPGTMQE